MSDRNRDWLIVEDQGVRREAERYRLVDKRDWLRVASTGPHADIDLATIGLFCIGENITEKQARDAIVRVLRSGAGGSKFPLEGIGSLAWIASLFDPHGGESKILDTQWTVAFKKISRGHAKPTRHYSVAKLVQSLRDEGKPYQQAIEAAEEQFGLSERQVKRIYGKLKKEHCWK
jgi:hypothetical protein